MPKRLFNLLSGLQSPPVSLECRAGLIAAHNLRGLSMLSLAAALQGLVVNGPALPASAAARASAPVMMPIERIPGEGDPFQNGNMRRAEEIATKQPRGISTTEANLQYIETEDEPWCAAAPPPNQHRCRPKKVVLELPTRSPVPAAAGMRRAGRPHGPR